MIRGLIRPARRLELCLAIQVHVPAPCGNLLVSRWGDVITSINPGPRILIARFDAASSVGLAVCAPVDTAILFSPLSSAWRPCPVHVFLLRTASVPTVHATRARHRRLAAILNCLVLRATSHHGWRTAPTVALQHRVSILQASGRLEDIIDEATALSRIRDRWLRVEE